METAPIRAASRNRLQSIQGLGRIEAECARKLQPSEDARVLPSGEYRFGESQIQLRPAGNILEGETLGQTLPFEPICQRRKWIYLSSSVHRRLKVPRDLDSSPSRPNRVKPIKEIGRIRPMRCFVRGTDCLSTVPIAYDLGAGPRSRVVGHRKADRGAAIRAQRGRRGVDATRNRRTR